MAIESIWGLVEGCEVKVLGPGEVLLERGQANRTMYMVLSGKLSVHLEALDSPPVAHLEEGQTVGSSRSSTAARPRRGCAPTEIRVCSVSLSPPFGGLVRASYEFSTNLLLLLA